ncbi:MAG TPA: NAD-dependent epimerase/dehydratase family protein, partial [Caballeronia sp.]|nr:NAD-dependent epimerase/dehydratase family protein [Caballeronia sp.]
MNILITGGAGILGQRLARRLLERGNLMGQPITGLTLLDVVRPPDLGDKRVRAETGDIADRSVLERCIG